MNAHLVKQHRTAIVVAAACPCPLEGMALNLTHRTTANDLLGMINQIVIGPSRECSENKFSGADPQGHARFKRRLVNSAAIDPGAVPASQITHLPSAILRITLKHRMPTTRQSIGNDNAGIGRAAEGVLPVRIEDETRPVPTANPKDQRSFQPNCR